MVKLYPQWILVLVALTCETFGEKEVIFPTTKPNDQWWSNEIVYQVYPRSFKDSNGDGIGDLKGITQELDYFVDLGVKILWISPIFKSPMDDMGYDVENYTTIDPIFGSMADFEELISEMNKRDLKLLLEIVPNHSSYKCEWFLKSIQKHIKYDNYYVWHNALNQDQLGDSSVVPEPPNNWVSNFGGSAWSWNAERKQFYLHQFSDRQPDFNFRNPEVHQEFFKIMEFWLDKGVAGFRFHSVGKLYENKDFLNEPKSSGQESWPKYYALQHIHTNDQPEAKDAIIEWRKFMDDYSKRKSSFPRLLAADAHNHVCVYSLVNYYGNETNPGADIPFNYHLMIILRKEDLVDSMNTAIQFWFDVVPANNTPNWVIESPDTDRIASKFGPEMVQVLTALKLSLPGIDVTYYGSEIGMENTYVRPDRIQDSYDSGGQRNRGSRDFARTPMQWNDKGNGGFTTSNRSWLPVNPNYYKLNVETQKKIPTSNFNFYKKMSGLRKTKTLKYGDLQTYNNSDSIYAIKRSLPGHESYFVVMNFGSEIQTVVLSNILSDIGEKLYVYLGSENSAYSAGNVVSTNSKSEKPLQLRPKSVVVLTDNLINVDTMRSAANRHIGFKFVCLFIALFTVGYLNKK